MKCYYTDRFALALPPGHSFPADKYRLLRERIERSALGGVVSLEVPDAASVSQLELVHTAQYVSQVSSGEFSSEEIRRLGFPWNPALAERARRSVGACIGAARIALQDGVACSLAGGTHHAFADRGEGFCVFNDCAVAARTLQREAGLVEVLIFDCDVHQGNGTADIFASDPTVYTVSIHAGSNFPLRKTSSDIDVELADGTSDGGYLEVVSETLSAALAGCRPDLVLYVAGADPYENDRLGRLKVTKEGLSRRDQFVIDTVRDRGVPVALVLGGGYGPVEDVVDIHCETVARAWAGWRRVRTTGA